MDELQRSLDAQASRFADECEILEIEIDRILDSEKPIPEALQIAVSQAKRVRRDATIIIRTLAKMRDNLQP